MYRKPLLTADDMQALVGRVVRLEWSSMPPRVGVCVEADDQRIILQTLDDRYDDLYCINAAYVVFATTDPPQDDEAPFEPVFWRDRFSLQP